jgi:sugar (pentulose or hexulose) kinase
VEELLAEKPKQEPALTALHESRQHWQNCAVEEAGTLTSLVAALLLLLAGLLKPGVLYRAALEGATLSLAAALSRATELGLVPKELRVVGGGSKNPLWRQIVADVFQLPVK